MKHLISLIYHLDTLLFSLKYFSGNNHNKLSVIDLIEHHNKGKLLLTYPTSIL